MPNLGTLLTNYTNRNINGKSEAGASLGWIDGKQRREINSRDKSRGADMPRGPRLDAPGTWHHVIVRGIERRKIVDSR